MKLKPKEKASRFGDMLAEAKESYGDSNKYYVTH